MERATSAGGASKAWVGATPHLHPSSHTRPGLHPFLLRALTLQGYRTPTPIQRAAIPSLLAAPPRDLVGMARTGSGKTLAYMIPLVQRLSGRHAHAFGVRAIILVPARELALQVVKVGKSLVKGWKSEAAPHAGEGHDDDDDNSKSGSGETLRWGLIVGGEGMDEQFEMISGNPDVSVIVFVSRVPLSNIHPVKVSLQLPVVFSTLSLRCPFRLPQSNMSSSTKLIVSSSSAFLLPCPRFSPAFLRHVKPSYSLPPSQNLSSSLRKQACGIQNSSALMRNLK